MRRSLAVCAAAMAVSAPSATPADTDVSVVVDHLNNPRAVTIAPDGDIYVAEAGRAGPRCAGVGEERACWSLSGSITRVRNGTARRVVRGLLSVGGRDGSFTGGAAGVSVTQNGTIYIAMGGSGCMPLPRGLPPAGREQLDRLLKVGPRGRRAAVANVGALECRTNAGGAVRNANPYAVLAHGRGRELGPMRVPTRSWPSVGGAAGP